MLLRRLARRLAIRRSRASSISNASWSGSRMAAREVELSRDASHTWPLDSRVSADIRAPARSSQSLSARSCPSLMPPPCFLRLGVAWPERVPAPARPAVVSRGEGVEVRGRLALDERGARGRVAAGEAAGTGGWAGRAGDETRGRGCRLALEVRGRLRVLGREEARVGRVAGQEGVGDAILVGEGEL